MTRRGLTPLALLVVLVVSAGCTPTLRPAPSTEPATPSPACVDAWAGALAAAPGSGPAEAPMRACGSLEQLAAGYAAAHGAAPDDPTAKRRAEELCGTGRFSATPICRQLGITP
jgi:hypothetical protein